MPPTPFLAQDTIMRRGGQAFASSLQLLAYVRVKAWNEPKGYGFGAPCDEGGKFTSEETLLIHPANFVKNPRSRTPTSVKPGAVIQGDIGEKNGKPVLENITNREGAALSGDLAFVGTRVNQNLMTKNLLSRDGASAPKGARLDQTDFLLKQLVESMRRIDKDLNICRSAQKKTTQLLAHIMDKHGIKELAVGEEYLATKDKIWKLRVEHLKSRRGTNANGEAHSDDEELDDVEVAPAAPKEDDGKFEVDSLLDETKAEVGPGQGKKSKKAKKTTKADE